MKYTIKLSEDVVNLLINHGTKISHEGIIKYRFLSYWFEHIEDNVFEMHMLDHLPKELINDLNFMRRPDSKEPLKQY
jgi:hypothetical protein